VEGHFDSTGKDSLVYQRSDGSRAELDRALARPTFFTSQELAFGVGTGMALNTSLLPIPSLSPLNLAPTQRTHPAGSSIIKDIQWEMGPPIPFPSKGQAQAIIGESLIGAGGAQLMQ
jgi:hypothetical protein